MSIYVIPHWYRALSDAVFIDSVAFSLESNVLYGAGYGTGGIRCWDAHSGESRGIFATAGMRIEALAAHPLAPILASGNEGGVIQFWDTRTARPLLELRGHTDAVIDLAFSRDGSVLVSGGRDQTLRLWDPRSGRCIATLPDYKASFDCAWAGSYLASVTTDGAVAIWDLPTGQREDTFRDYEGEASVVAYHPRGDCLAVATDAYTIACWYPGERRVETIFCGYDTSVNSLLFDSTGSVLIAGMGSEDVPIRVWDLAPPHATMYIRGQSDESCTIAISPDGRYLACGANGNTASVETWRLM